MEKNWKFNGRSYTMRKIEEYDTNAYSLNGYLCKESLIWYYCDDKEEQYIQLKVRAMAEAFVDIQEFIKAPRVF